MFIADLFEAKVQKIVVIMPGGFHPFHTGHLSLYSSAVRAFPGADVYVAATNDTKARPFPFEIKKELATIAGVPEGHFIQVKSPFQSKEITSQYDPNTTALVFVRSEKDRNEAPQAGGVKKDGSPSYLQPITTNLKPMSQHGYMAYLPTVEFAGGITSATQIRDAWTRGDAKAHEQIAKTLYPQNPERAMQLLGSALNEDVTEGTNPILANLTPDQIKGVSMMLKGGHTLPDILRIFDNKITQQQIVAIAHMNAGVAEDDEHGRDIKRIPIIQKARIAHPMAKNDEEALALFIADREESDVHRLDLENEHELDMINKIDSVEHDLEQKIVRITHELDTLKQKLKMANEDASGVIATRVQAKDPRYSMSLTKDVRPGQIQKNLKAFKLI